MSDNDRDEFALGPAVTPDYATSYDCASLLDGVEGLNSGLPSLDPSNQSGKPEDGIILAGGDDVHPEFRLEPIRLSEGQFRHGGWRHTRARVWTALKASTASRSCLHAFCNCGSGLWCQVNSSGDRARLVSNKCRSRWCLPCAADRAAIFRSRLLQCVESKRIRFVTLTMRHNRTSLSDQLDRLLSCFLALRRRNWWKGVVTGGASFVECKVSAKSGMWHVHLHCLVEGSFMPQRDLSKEWMAVTGDSSIVDVRDARDETAVTSYVVKYVTKPADGTIFRDPERLLEMIMAMRGRRLCTTFGTWRGMRLSEVDDDGEEWHSVASVSSIVADRGALLHLLLSSLGERAKTFYECFVVKRESS